jgi:hypothetical protein
MKRIRPRRQLHPVLQTPDSAVAFSQGVPRSATRSDRVGGELTVYRWGLQMFPACRAVLTAPRTWLAILLLLAPRLVQAGYLDENPEEVFAGVYERLGALPLRAARDPYVWLRLEELKREPCDQKSIDELAMMLDQLGYRREAASGLYKFFRNCGAPLTALRKSVGIYLKLTDYDKAVEVADEYAL